MEKEIGERFMEIPFDDIGKRVNIAYATNENGDVEGMHLVGAGLTAMPACLSGLDSLKILYAFNNEMSDISVLAGLTQLTTLSLYNNKLSDISVLAGFEKLTKLSVACNGLTDIRVLEGLTQLTSLELSYNQLSDIGVLSGLTQLESLDLRNNQIKTFPEAMLQLDMDIDIEEKYGRQNHMGLYGNPLESPPPEIIKEGKEAIKNYFKSLETGEGLPLNEVKVLLVGDGGAGKTSLVKRLRGKEFDRNEAQTHGINIDQWTVTCGQQDITTRLWDFGGQEIMHATHQFFLSKRSLYVLVLDGRKDEKTDYWLKHIQSFGDISPVLVVLNKIDENPGFELNRKNLKEKYPNIIGFYRLSCASGDGVNAFSDALTCALDKVEIISTTWPETWFKVKKRLEDMNMNKKKPFIGYQEYQEICRDEKVQFQEGMKTLVQFLNDLGVVVYFDDAQLSHLHVLDPRWVTEGVYKIVTSKQLAEEKGVLKLERLDVILKQDKKKGFSYPKETYPYIIQLMKKFELCYEINTNEILVPDLLAVEEPPFTFPEPGEDTDIISFEFKYGFLPPSIMPRFIVRRHKDIETCWRTGVLLSCKSYQARALIKADLAERQISIQVSGQQKKDYFAVLRHTLWDINDDFKKLDIEERVPLPDQPNMNVLLEELIGHELDNKKEIYIGRLRKNYDVSKLLYGIVSSKEIQKELARYQGKPPEKGDTYHLHLMVANQLQHVETIQKTEVDIDVDVDVDVHIDINLKIDLPAIVSQFNELKDHIESLPGLKEPQIRELSKLEDRLDDLEEDTDKKEFKKTFTKIQRFMEKLADDSSTFNKVLKGTTRGVELAQKAGETYNKFAQWLALPQVPEFFLGKKK